MLENLQKDLLQLQNKNQEQELLLQNVFLNLHITKNQLSGFYAQIPPSQNLLNKVRPEVFNQILDFIDLKSYLRFRLINQRANQIVIQMIPNRITQIQQIMTIRQLKLQEFIQGNQQNDLLQDLVQRQQNAEQGLNLLTKANVTEIKHLKNPPQTIYKVMTMVCILLDSTFKADTSTWSDCLKLIDNSYFINQLKNLDLQNLDEKRLKLLQDIHSISEEQVQRVSIACMSFYQFIRAVVEIRESKVYLVKFQKDQFEKLIKKDEMALLHLQKMNGQ